MIIILNKHKESLHMEKDKDSEGTSAEILNTIEVCSYLRISKGTLRKIKIPHIRIRRRVMFRKIDIEQFVLNNLKDQK